MIRMPPLTSGPERRRSLEPALGLQSAAIDCMLPAPPRPNPARGSDRMERSPDHDHSPGRYPRRRRHRGHLHRRCRPHARRTARHPQAPLDSEQLCGRGHRRGAQPARRARIPARRAGRAAARLHRRHQCDPRRQGRPDRAAHHPGIPRRAGAAAGCGCRTSTSRSTSARRRSCRGSYGSRSTSERDRAARCSVPSTKRTCGAAAERIRVAGIEAVAVCYLHSYANPAHEQRTGAILREMLPDAFVSLSVDVLPRKLEYERTSTTVVNAYVGPPVKHYVRSMVSQDPGCRHRRPADGDAVERRHPGRGRGGGESGPDRRVRPGRGGRRRPALHGTRGVRQRDHARHGGEPRRRPRSSSRVGSRSPTSTRWVAGCRRAAR